MKILVVGAGIIGTIYGWALAQGGHDITHLVRPGKALQFREGIQLDMLDKRKGHPRRYSGRYALKVTETLGAQDGYELVIVPTKPYQMLAALEQLIPQAGAAGFLLLTQNWDGPACVDALLPRPRYLYGDAKAGGAFINGVLVSTIFPSLDIGQVGGQQGPLLHQVAGLFASIQVEPVIQEDILHYIWVQYAINAGLWPPVVRGGGLEAVLHNPELGDLGLQAVRECLQVVARRGVNLRRYPETRLYLTTSRLVRRLAGIFIRLLFRFNEGVMRSSLHALGDRREIQASFFDLLSTGKALGVSLPVMGSFEADIQKFAGEKK